MLKKDMIHQSMKQKGEKGHYQQGKNYWTNER